MKLGVADYGILAWCGGFWDYEDRLLSVHKIGYDGVERLEANSPEDALTKAAWLKKNGMSFGTCLAPKPELSIKWTSALEREYVWAEIYAYDMESYKRGLNEMTKAASKYGIKIVVHNHLGSFAESQENIEEILRDCPDAYLLFDTGHLAVAGGDIKYIAEKYYNRIVAYHLKGWQQSETPDAENWMERGYFCGIGQGNFFIDNEFVFKNAVKKGFDGWVYIEHDTHIRDPFTDLKESYDILQNWRKEI